MAEMDGLRKRVELIDLRLKKAHSAREQESAALMETWEQIRNRYQDQSAEIIKLRNRIADLEDTREDLQNMVYSLLSAVEGGLENMADETVPQIKTMAQHLLSGDGGTNTVDNDVPDTPANNGNFHKELLSAIEQTVAIASEDDVVRNGVTDDRPIAAPQPRRDAPASPGIRNLISRIEDAVGEDFLEPQLASDDNDLEDNDDLSRDLREIETLRNELNGLRHRISAGAF